MQYRGAELEPPHDSWLIRWLSSNCGHGVNVTSRSNTMKRYLLRSLSEEGQRAWISAHTNNIRYIKYEETTRAQRRIYIWPVVRPSALRAKQWCKSWTPSGLDRTLELSCAAIRRRSTRASRKIKGVGVLMQRQQKRKRGMISREVPS